MFIRTAVILFAIASLAADWPGWRGPTGMGHSAEKDLPLRWGGKENLNVAWKVQLAGVEANAGQDHNQSSPVVFGDRVFVTLSYWPGKPDAKEYPQHRVVCYRATDGEQLWDMKVPPGPWLNGDLRGGYTAPTPAVDAERIYVAFGSSVLAALDHQGRILWRREIHPFKFDVAFAGSPVLYRDTLIVQCDQLQKQSMLAAFDRKTGEPRWETKRPDVNFSHSTPVLATVAGKPQLLVSSSNCVQGYNPDDGREIWRCTAKGDTVSPVIGNGIVYCDSGRGGPGVAVDPGGTGDVTATHVKWKVDKVPDGYSSPIIVGDYLYRLHSPEQLRCTRLANGEVVYSERLAGISTSISPVATADGRIYLAGAGKSYVVKAGPAFEVLAVNDLGDGGHASPAIADGKIFLKGRKWLYCIAKKE